MVVIVFQVERPQHPLCRDTPPAGRKRIVPRPDARAEGGAVVVVERGCGVRQEEEKDEEKEGKEQEDMALRGSRGGEHGPVSPS
jgi:hypothetical protein